MPERKDMPGADSTFEGNDNVENRRIARVYTRDPYKLDSMEGSNCEGDICDGSRWPLKVLRAEGVVVEASSTVSGNGRVVEDVYRLLLAMLASKPANLRDKSSLFSNALVTAVARVITELRVSSTDVLGLGTSFSSGLFDLTPVFQNSPGEDGQYQIQRSFRGLDTT